ncbi:hypothetical protein Bhyg_16094 [Pseudolycoriella hygida]|uniref:Uncharacterized protein n=1 Tax=Pseudolycoriella hygida TaxID=35572 RepID=A0A9Q0MLS6_9DIPT|nr:hypothetical protein Bhyg_16094 [Pseudolycoriella hygida]
MVTTNMEMSTVVRRFKKEMYGIN